MKVGILALQGDVPEHRRALEPLVGAGSVLLVHHPKDLEAVDALVLPGGESTTLSRLIDDSGLRQPLAARIEAGLPVLATCAGLILLSRRLEGTGSGREPNPIGVLDVTVRRNDFGRQKESFEAPVTVDGLSGRPFPGVFIRAPRILSVGPGARTIARMGSEPVGVRSGHVWGLTFHPELSADPRLHRRFLSEVVEPAQRSKARARTTTKRTRATATARR
jgi:5'-phosphate synthase pdxT subunit